MRLNCTLFKEKNALNILKKKPDMLHEQYHIKIIFMVHLEKNKALHIF